MTLKVNLDCSNFPKKKMEVIINIQQIAKNLMYRIIPFYTF